MATDGGGAEVAGSIAAAEALTSAGDCPQSLTHADCHNIASSSSSSSPSSSSSSSSSSMHSSSKALNDLLKVVSAVARDPSAGGCPWVASQSSINMVAQLRGEADEFQTELEILAAATTKTKVEDGGGGDKALSGNVAVDIPSSKKEKKKGHAALQNELGDVIFDALLLAAVAARDHAGVSMSGCFEDAAAKVRRRCPHIFGKAMAATAADASALWLAAKAQEKEGED